MEDLRKSNNTIKTLINTIESQKQTHDALINRIVNMKEALRLADAALSGANMDMKVVQNKIKEALGNENS